MDGKPKLLVSPKDIRPTIPIFRVRGAINPAAVRLGNGNILLLARITETPKHGEKYFLAPRFEGRKKSGIVMEKIPRHECRWDKGCFIMHGDIARLPTISHFRKILLDKGGMDVKEVSQRPHFTGLTEDGDFGVEDPRITRLEGNGRYAMTYVSVSKSTGVSTSLALSSDLNHWERRGIIFRQQNKDAVIFPEKANGEYVALHRPEGTMIFDRPSIWVSYSKDLVYWGRDKAVMAPRKGMWDGLRIGSGTVPIKTEEGWLMIYHGVQNVDLENDESPKIYSAGAVLFSPKNPAMVIARSPPDKPLFSPEKEFERHGFVNNVVFPTSALTTPDGKSLLIYSGAADSCISVRKMALKRILSSLE